MRNLYRHYKGGLYVKLNMAKWHDADNNAPSSLLVIYQSVKAPFEIYARPSNDFHSVTANGEARFERVGQVP